MGDYINDIEALGACPEAVEWLRAERHATVGAAWDACPRGDWMLWLAGLCAGPPGDPRRVPLALAAADCAELALGCALAGEDRPRLAVEAVRAWVRGEVPLEAVRAAATGAAAAWAAGVAAGGAEAAWAAEAAAKAAVGAVGVAVGAAAWVAARVAAKAGGGAALRAAHAATADIVRRHYPAPPVWVAVVTPLLLRAHPAHATPPEPTPPNSGMETP